MEWLRSCYKSKWRCFNNTLLETPGEYVFVTSGTPHCPVPHIFGSFNWITEDGAAGLGEQRGFRADYSKGSVPFPIPPPQMLGDPREVTAGGAFPHPVVPRTLPYGFDSRLWTQQGLTAPSWPGCGAGIMGEVESASVTFSVTFALTGLMGEVESANVGSSVTIGGKGLMGELESGSVTHHP